MELLKTHCGSLGLRYCDRPGVYEQFSAISWAAKYGAMGPLARLEEPILALKQMVRPHQRRILTATVTNMRCWR